LPVEDYYDNKANKDGLAGKCKKCVCAYRRKRYQVIGSHEMRKHHLRRTYGITPEKYARLLKKQKDFCAICLRPETLTRYGKPQSLSVDHNHKTGNVRALLCSKCNLTVGYVQEDIERMKRVIQYIELHNIADTL
jgi:hypothetical protein